MSPSNKDPYKRGVLAAAAVAADYNASSTHPYRLDDCIACKLNATPRKKPRKNKRHLENPDDAWVRGAATVLAEVHRWLIGGNDSANVRRTAAACGITIAYAKKSGVTAYDLKELRKAGVR